MTPWYQAYVGSCRTLPICFSVNYYYFQINIYSNDIGLTRSIYKFNMNVNWRSYDVSQADSALRQMGQGYVQGQGQSQGETSYFLPLMMMKGILGSLTYNDPLGLKSAFKRSIQRTQWAQNDFICRTKQYSTQSWYLTKSFQSQFWTNKAF